MNGSKTTARWHHCQFTVIAIATFAILGLPTLAQETQSLTLDQLRKIDAEDKPLRLDPEKTVLLIVDMQRYFVRPDYPFAQSLEKLYPGISKDYFE